MREAGKLKWILLDTKLCLVVSAEKVLLRLPRQAELGLQALPSETW